MHSKAMETPAPQHGSIVFRVGHIQRAQFDKDYLVDMAGPKETIHV